ncbi:RRI1 [Candida theae]|uniref:COP9 signalosome complex subunit 5 n=1 Tax=Candida theae TaxID=1198502 RepID=A0AAD5BJC4_9ASCO|nr:RRI1 [Candida theae]KAI5968364.1 RRI1 [Candida theae]
MSVYSELAQYLDSNPSKDPKSTGTDAAKDISRRVGTSTQGSTRQGNDSHGKSVADQLYELPAIDRKISHSKPWKTDSKYFNKCKISALALMKMTTHAQSGGSIEIMGMLVGKIVDRAIVVMDTYRLPVEGTETRVNAQGEAYEYMVQYLELNQKISDGVKPRQENIVGWYHSHPGYGCWLSGIDVSTQELNQNFQDPYLAIVVDPVRTLKSGKVDIGAFRTLPAGFTEGGETNDGASRARLSNLPKSKRKEFGSHAGRYYSLEVETFANENDEEMLKLMRRQDTDDYDGWMKKLSVDDAETIKAVQEDSALSSLQYLDNFEFIDGGDDIDSLRNVVKRLEALKSTPGEGPASSFLKKIINANKSVVEGSKLRGMSRHRHVSYEDEDVLDESDLERVYTGEDKLEDETEGEDWDDDDEDVGNDAEMQDERQQAAQGAAQEVAQESAQVAAQDVAEENTQDVARDDIENTDLNDKLEQATTTVTNEPLELRSVETATPTVSGEAESLYQGTDKPPSSNPLSSPIKRSFRKKIRTRKDDLSDLLFDPSIAGTHHKLKRKQKPVSQPLGFTRYPEEYTRQVELLDLHRRVQQHQRWARDRLPGDQQGRYSMPPSMALDMREKNKSVIEASRALAAKNVCDLITMEAMERKKREAKGEAKGEES